MYASGIYSNSVVLSVKMTATTSKWHSPLPKDGPLWFRRNPLAAEAILLCFAKSTLSCGGACMFSRRAFTSTKCIPSALAEMISISRCPLLKFLSSIVCPFACSASQARSSPRFPIVCLLFLRSSIPSLPSAMSPLSP